MSQHSQFGKLLSEETSSPLNSSEEPTERPPLPPRVPRQNPHAASKHHTGDLESETLLGRGELETSDYSWKKHGYHSIFSNLPITPTQKFEDLMTSQRTRYVLWFIYLVVFSPLVFRYVMGAYSPDNKTTTLFLLPANATIQTTVKYQDCVSCPFTPGVTLLQVDITVTDVTVPDNSGNAPSIALYTSQNFKDWYSFYKPARIQDAYIRDYSLTSFVITNESLACLGDVYANYLVVCLNNRNLAATLDLGESVGSPPFNDNCFQLNSTCGTTCVDSTTNGGQFPIYCEDGMIPQSLLVTNKTETDTTGSDNIDWGGDLTAIEWFILIVIFLDTFGNILKALPLISGRPTELESSHLCRLDGVTVLGCASPFVSEDEAVFLRSLLGRTCTMLRTVGGRHTLHAMYVDLILNEKRGPGEKVRFHLWKAWLRFLEKMIEVSASKEDTFNSSKMSSTHILGALAGADVKNSQSRDFRAQSDPAAMSINSEADHRQSIVVDDMKSSAYLRTLTASHLLSNSHPAKIVLDSQAEPMDARDSVFSGARVSFLDNNMQRTFSASGHGNREHTVSFDGVLPPIAPSVVPMSTEDDSPASDALLNGGDSVSCGHKTYSMAQLMPMLAFLDGWLHVVKETEWTFDYFDKKSALDNLFSAAPLEMFYSGPSLLSANVQFRGLVDVFRAAVAGTPIGPKETPPTYPIFPDEVAEYPWKITRPGLPDWIISWTFMSRARLIQDPKVKDDDNSILKAIRSRYGEAEMLLESTRIQRGAVVWMHPDSSEKRSLYASGWLKARSLLYKVESISRGVSGTSVTLFPLSNPRAPDVEAAETVAPVAEERTKITSNIHRLSLLEQNRGKAGALNACLQFLKAKGIEWCHENQYDESKVQMFMGIVDARHMLAEPDIFWNEALPFFSGLKAGSLSKDYGSNAAGAQLCINVQYPQFFSNVRQDDFLDNKNSAYYTVWQTLRDGAKATTSSGTNAIWDVSNPSFGFATTSRIEDTGTSQKYLAKYVSVHLPCFVAYGVAKQTGDYIEAVYRWSTGAVELFWATFFTPAISHYVVIALIALLLACACFWKSIVGYLLWLSFLSLLAFAANRDRSFGYKPLRRLVVSSVIVMNTMYWISNLLSITWLIIMPIRIAFYGVVPISNTLDRSLFWAFAATVLRLPPALMADRLAAMCRFLSPRTADWNYSLVMWRSSQLYSCSFAYSFLSVISGSLNSLNAYRHGKDLTMWSSFLVKQTDFDKASQKIAAQKSICSASFWSAVWEYFSLLIKNFFASLTMPETLTKYYALSLFILQFVCLVVSFYVTNRDDVTAVFVTLLICGLNIFLVFDITILLFPSITYIVGRPARPEYIFAFLGLIILATTLDRGSVTPQNIRDYLMFEF